MIIIKMIVGFGIADLHFVCLIRTCRWLHGFISCEGHISMILMLIFLDTDTPYCVHLLSTYSLLLPGENV